MKWFLNYSNVGSASESDLRNIPSSTLNEFVNEGLSDMVRLLFTLFLCFQMLEHRLLLVLSYKKNIFFRILRETEWMHWRWLIVRRKEGKFRFLFWRNPPLPWHCFQGLLIWNLPTSSVIQNTYNFFSNSYNLNTTLASLRVISMVSIIIGLSWATWALPTLNRCLSTFCVRLHLRREFSSAEQLSATGYAWWMMPSISVNGSSEVVERGQVNGPFFKYFSGYVGAILTL